MSTDQPDADAFAMDVAEEAEQMDAGFVLFFFSQALISAADLAAAVTRHSPRLHHAGCSTAGEITPFGIEEGQTLAILFPSRSFTVAGRMIRGLSITGMDAIAADVGVLRRTLAARTGRSSETETFAICLIDGMSFAEETVTSAIHWGLDDIPLVGGSAGDDLKFETTTLFYDGIVDNDAAVVLLVSTDVPFQVFKTENFVATDEKLVVTASDPDRRIVREFNAVSAAEEFAFAIGVVPDALTPLSFASHPVVVRVGGEYYCRSIQKLNADRSLSFFCAIDDGVVLSIAQPTELVETTRSAFEDIGRRIGRVDVILGFDCVLRRLDARNRQVLRDLSELYRANNLIGFGTYGEQYRTMHLNQTLTGIAFGCREAA
ncbi:FIST C-terminal domain-containing protein [Pseudaminobacter sp. 19-2017]|uniref:FIST C-terminal domain-containing protein n=1 Tax=Pseudaminobacter soli (ex Zhang et al. 2022) TaxID=2831468 RepID=A0A942I1Z0_9HYPH|nr:FIST N-terminal domain-containing protein [Pseudaminobacter soli]MBS3647509.1 FIST C-terminal domain-containing protein [Pseudaminobacter soli]